MNFAPQVTSLLQRVLPGWVDPALVLKAISFGLIGCVNAAIHLTVFSVGYYLLGFYIVVANVIAWCVAVTNSYIMNSLFTFAAESGRRLSIKGHLTFAATQIVGLIANTITIYVVARLVPEAFANLIGLDPVLIGAIVAIGVSFLVDFTLSHLVVFRRGQQEPHP
jgi:putative flippase GtrA